MSLLRRVIGGVLRRLRIRQGRTLREVAAAAGVSVPYLSEVERGRKEASSEVLAAICRALGIRLSDLLEEARDDLRRLEPRTPVPQPRVAAGRRALPSGPRPMVSGARPTPAAVRPAPARGTSPTNRIPTAHLAVRRPYPGAANRSVRGGRTLRPGWHDPIDRAVRPTLTHRALRRGLTGRAGRCHGQRSVDRHQVMLTADRSGRLDGEHRVGFVLGGGHHVGLALGGGHRVGLAVGGALSTVR
ncbi:helix-turn-helix domain-containing protein [Micromonospora cathayae]|uniref:Helix-turn-helix domain-containing protein n=1 Tax=Micromonospora cathayae TaxID=3028804 RepID=A0ABY7ZUQ5_9ACTN|nr:helix-turn-helix domain-containing protein [Micromonospora sp. HUAS 3]WDZ86625.1 helix-turn-helix domain-containing protein [Micromonospora sp. HUAS 3]